MASSINIFDIIPTHNRLRNPSKVFEFSSINKPISLSRIEDKIYCHDGHHRLCWFYLHGFYELTNEYKIINKTYEDYFSINREVGYLTPFDPRTECRIPHFFPIKKILSKMSNEDIYRNRHLFIEKREIYNVTGLV